MDYKLACEYRDIALRAKHLAVSRKKPEEVELLLDMLEAVAEPVLVIVRHCPLSPDEADDMVLDVAINGNADAVVSNNTEHFREPAERFQLEGFD